LLIHSIRIRKKSIRSMDMDPRIQVINIKRRRNTRKTSIRYFLRANLLMISTKGMEAEAEVETAATVINRGLGDCKPKSDEDF